MAKAKVSGMINASANEVWKFASDFNGLDKFVGAVSHCTTRGSGIGAVRTLTLEDGGKVKEKLESLDHDKRKLTYSIVESPMPIQNYTGTMQIRELEEEQSEFSWVSTFEAAEEVENDIREALEGLYSLGIEGLQNKF